MSETTKTGSWWIDTPRKNFTEAARANVGATSSDTGSFDPMLEATAALYQRIREHKSEKERATRAA